MNKLYIFGIGGTGVRVIKSLTFLLASGVKFNNKFEIVPIIFDPHIENENLKEAISLLKIYEQIKKTTELNDGFFKTRIRTLRSVANTDNIPDSYAFRLGGSQHQRFRDFLQFDELSIESQAFVKTLFSDEHLNTEMDVGFLGNPNMGSVVLNQFKKSKEFAAFTNNFSEGDRVFIISSIFGGTGAAGFPIILKNIRRAADSTDVANKELLKNSPIGGLCMQPYFSVDADENSSIQKADWMLKTKSAFDYYQKAVTKPEEPAINAMYYLADTMGKSYKNDPGQDGQQNPAHLVEMIGALCIFDYADQPDEMLTTINGIPQDAYAREFGLLNDVGQLSFKDFGSLTFNRVARPLTQMFFFMKYLDEKLADSKDQSFNKSKPELGTSFYNGVFMQNYLKRFMEMYRKWLYDLQENERGFKPFNLQAEINNSINQFDSEKSLFGGKLNYTKYNDLLNEFSGSKDANYSKAEAKFTDIMHQATDAIIDKFFKAIN